MAAVAIAALTVTLLPAAPAAADEVRDRQYWLDEYGISAAWAVTRGEGTTIAVIDTGVDGSHPDLNGAVADGADFSGLGAANGQQPVGSEGPEHGTLVASLAAGRGSGAADGILGSAPAAKVLAISIGFGEGAKDSDTQIAEAVRWAVDQGADVINMSLTRNTSDWPESWDDAFLYAAQQDVVVVAAAGNRGSGTAEVGAPATMPGVLTVAGVDRAGNASFDASSQGITLGVAAPSEELVGALPGGGYAVWSGTSGAAPIVAGIVALVRAAHPQLDAANVINRLTATARDRGPAGDDFTYGYGLVGADAAVRGEVARVDANPMGDLAEWIRVYRRAESTDGGEVVRGVVPTVPAPQPEAWTPLGILLPTWSQLRLVGLPLLLLALFATVLATGLRGVVLGYRSERDRR